MGTTTARPRLLDLSRTVRRAGRVPTGIDRVEAAYLDHLGAAGPLFGLVRTSLGHVLLGPDGCAWLGERLRDGAWGGPDWRARLVPGIDPVRAAAEAGLRRRALARCLPTGLPEMLWRHLPPGASYVNVGQTNLTPRVLRAVKRAGAQVAVMVHDTIPLDHPDWQRPGSPDQFAAFLDRAVRGADLILCNSAATRDDLRRHARAPLPQTLVAHLGVTPAAPTQTPHGPWSGKPLFVVLGTIEPRKNHAMLLDIWPDIPGAHLLVCGARGWANEVVFATLDARPDRVHELPGLDDGAVAALLRDACALLFPSHAEGFGLPPAEALALGTPVLCSDLSVLREVLGDNAVYLRPDDAYSWRKAIIDRVSAHRAGAGARHADSPAFAAPTWEAHFKSVLTRI